ncbi:GNAT family N-acetyltransferase [Flexivirga caeni]|uniref:GNAT family N-acetyltransferase n=1 Tax=Flexivirga caeni TaxID=2294115 RepID=A0A3M9M1P7_9MICO|nr:GNAT family N-acetyltransferase [Flexivirga caeni]
MAIRWRLPDSDVPEGGPHFTDVLGQVRAVDDESVVVDTRGGVATVRLDRIALARRVPPPPVRRPRRAPGGEDIGIDDLQVLMTAGMPPLDSARVGEWLLRSAEGYTGRANSALPVGDPGIPLLAAIEQVTAWYGERNQPALVQLPHPADANPQQSELGSFLAQHNWRFLTRTLVMTRPTSATAPSGPAHSPLPRMTASSPNDGAISPSLGESAVTRDNVAVSESPSDDWWSSASPRSLEHRDTLASVLELIPEAAYLTAYAGDQPVGHLRLAFTDGWSGVFDVHTDPASRRTGVARALLASATEVAAQRRIPLQYLQVAADNLAAVGLYESLGWRVHHAYHYATAAR